MRKKDRCAVFECNNDRLFPEKYTLKFSFCPKSAKKSNKFNMACVSVKSSIEINHNLISVSELLGELKMLLLKRKNVFAL